MQSKHSTRVVGLSLLLLSLSLGSFLPTGDVMISSSTPRLNCYSSSPLKYPLSLCCDLSTQSHTYF